MKAILWHSPKTEEGGGMVYHKAVAGRQRVYHVTLQKPLFIPALGAAKKIQIPRLSPPLHNHVGKEKAVLSRRLFFSPS